MYLQHQSACEHMRNCSAVIFLGKRTQRGLCRVSLQAERSLRLTCLLVKQGTIQQCGDLPGELDLCRTSRLRSGFRVRGTCYRLHRCLHRNREERRRHGEWLSNIKIQTWKHLARRRCHRTHLKGLEQQPFQGVCLRIHGYVVTGVSVYGSCLESREAHRRGICWRVAHVADLCEQSSQFRNVRI